MARKALALCGLIAALEAGCSKNTTTKSDRTPIPKNDDSANTVVVEYKEYKDGYKKTINNSPYGQLNGEYRSVAVPSPMYPKISVFVSNNNVLRYVVDQDDDGKADYLQLEGYLDPSRRNRADNQSEFKLADEILKYWKETK